MPPPERSPHARGGDGQVAPPIEIVCATRLAEKDFWLKSALGLSLRRIPLSDGIRATIAFENRLGLPTIYNRRIADPTAGEWLVFVHDDVWIDDIYLAEAVVEGLQHYDVIGVAGNRRRVDAQPGWAFVDEKLTWDEPAHLSGRIAHAAHPFGQLSVFGAVPAECELLDGVFLATRRSTLAKHGLAFDSRFDFHFYDLDFCRSARLRSLRLGTWRISLTHQSKGAFATPGWAAGYRAYLEKWGS